MPKQMVKYRFKMEGWTVTLSACESCENFPGWIRVSSYGFLSNSHFRPSSSAMDVVRIYWLSIQTHLATLAVRLLYVLFRPNFITPFQSDHIISALASENGKRAQIDGAPTRKRVRTNLPKPPRFPQVSWKHFKLKVVCRATSAAWSMLSHPVANALPGPSTCLNMYIGRNSVWSRTWWNTTRAWKFYYSN